jgi:prepilin-type N-terminal cleavage/methylation domain-containing protein
MSPEVDAPLYPTPYTLHPTPHTLHPLRAFTLFEMTLVVLILGILAAALIPPVGRNLTSPRLRTAANMLAADLEFCASESIAQPGAPRAITFDVAHNKYTLSEVGGGTTLKHPGDSQDYVNDFATGRNAQLAGVTITSVVSGAANLTTVTFDPYGKPQLAADLAVTLSYGGQSFTVTMSAATGDVTISG